MSNSKDKIQVGDYIIIQRQKYTKLHKFGNLNSMATLGKEQIELRNIEDKKYFSTFKMIPKSDGRNKKCSILEFCTETDMRSLRDVLGINESGVDNRHIMDNGSSQGLKSEDIDKLREECTGSVQIVEKIVENSKSFTSKTQYSQDKYLKKKEKKYFEYVQIIPPTIRLLSEIYYRQEPDKIMGIRMDSLSQIISYSGVCGYGNFLLYESGSNGLIPAALLNSIGAGTEAQLVHMHPGNVCQKQAINALNLPEEQVKRCISVNIYSVLREFYQNKSQSNNIQEQPDSLSLGEKRKANDSDELNIVEKKLKLENSDESIKTINNKPEEEKLKWQIENERARKLMKENFDGLIIAAREHPSTIIKALLAFLKPSRPIVIFNLSKEILMEIYFELKATTEVTKLHLTSNWLRMYQILPNRTHPEVQMNGNSGYLLCGYTVR